MSQVLYMKDYLSRSAIPERGENESLSDFRKRTEQFHKEDRRVPIAGRGMPNFGWCTVSFIGDKGHTTGTLGNKFEETMAVLEDGEYTDDYTSRPYGGGTFITEP